MKFKVEVDIDWFDDQETLDSEVQRKVIDKVVEQLTDKLKIVDNADVIKQAQDAFDARVLTLTKEFCNTKFDTYTKWGNKKEVQVCLRDVLFENLESYMNEKVDYSGKRRYEKVLDDYGRRQINDFLSKLSASIITGIREDINEAARIKITEAILSDYKLKDLIK